MQALARREHSRAELERKLAPHASSADELARALDELTAKGFISEARVVESVVHQKAAVWGAQRIRQHLRAKGVDDAAVGAALAQLQTSEAERARVVWTKRFGAVALTPVERAKQWRFLVARGFAPDVVRQVVAGSAEDCEG